MNEKANKKNNEENQNEKFIELAKEAFPKLDIKDIRKLTTECEEFSKKVNENLDIIHNFFMTKVSQNISNDEEVGKNFSFMAAVMKESAIMIDGLKRALDEDGLANYLIKLMSEDQFNNFKKTLNAFLEISKDTVIILMGIGTSFLTESNISRGKNEKIKTK